MATKLRCFTKLRWMSLFLAGATIAAWPTAAEARGRGDDDDCKGEGAGGVTVVATGDAALDPLQVQAALDLAAQGATPRERTVVCRGTFNFTSPQQLLPPFNPLPVRVAVLLPSNVALVGDDATFDLGPQEDQRVQANIPFAFGFGGNLAENVSLTGIRVTGGSRQVLLRNMNGLRIRDCRFEAGFSGITIFTSQDVEVRGNRVEDMLLNGISISGSAGVEVRDNRVEGCQQSSILLDSPTTAAEIRDNRVDGHPLGGGITVQSSTAAPVRVRDNRIRGAGRAGVSLFSANQVDVCDNHVIECAVGAEVAASVAIRLSDNHVRDSVTDGVRVVADFAFPSDEYLGSEATLVDNRITGSGGAGIRVIDSVVDLDDNSFKKNAGGNVVIETTTP